jgi:NhaP-type Na+/H+ or K+/H+ antiporter
MLCSSIIKEKLYIGEATVATLCGIIFGPVAANLINPLTWGNTDQITLEFSRIVLVVQCFAVGVELPKAYMERHWRSVTFLLVPVMTFGWLITSLFIWWLFRSHLNWLDSLVVAACVTATDPVLASSVVGKGKFAKRVPKHLRDLLSAESGSNDGMAFPFVYLGIYLIRYHQDAGHVTFHWLCFTVLYECLFGAVYGVLIGYLARRAIRYAHERDLIDRESFLVFYFVLALFCAGSGSILGLDDLLVGFACGVGFSNDGWFQEKTEESHVSNVIDLLINLAFFVYFGTIIPWNQFNADVIGISPWRLVVLAIFTLLFRRIPIMMMLKPIIPDLKTWREALFAGHFGPIGVGAIFVAILARAELETDTTTPLAELPEEGFPHLNIIELIWPITTFLVLCSIVVHGSSIAVFTLGKHINTLTLSFSYTTAVDDGPSWMERLPRIQSRSKSSMSQGRMGESELSLDEKNDSNGQEPGGSLSIPRNFLRRQKEEDGNGSRSSSRTGGRRRRRWDIGIGPGGPISQSAITPQSRLRKKHDSGDLADQEPSSDTEHGSPGSPDEPREEIFQEGNNMVIENEDGDVLEVRKSHPDESEQDARRNTKQDAHKLMEERTGESGYAHKPSGVRDDLDPKNKGSEKQPERLGWRKRMESFSGATRKTTDSEPSSAPPRPARHGPARAYTYGNTVIVEDEDGEVIKTYQIPSKPRPEGERRPTLTEMMVGKNTLDAISRMGNYFTNKDGSAIPEETRTVVQKKPIAAPTDDDDHIVFKLSEGGPRLRKDQFIQELTKMDSRTRSRVVDKQDVPDRVKHEVSRRASIDGTSSGTESRRLSAIAQGSRNQSSQSLDDVKTAESVPAHPVVDSLANFSFDRGGRETAAQRRRAQISGTSQKSVVPSATTHEDDDSDADDERPRGRKGSSPPGSSEGRSLAPTISHAVSYLEDAETAAEKRRRQAALGLTQEDDSSDDEEGTGFREPKLKETSNVSRSQQSATTGEPSRSRAAPRQNITFAESSTRDSTPKGPRLRWGEDVKKP